MVASADAPSGPPGGTPWTALQRVANRPILCHALDELRRAGVKSVALIIPAAADTAIRASIDCDGPADIDIRYVLQQPSAPIEDALEIGAQFVGEAPCVVSVGDGLLGQPLAPFVESLADDVPSLVALVHENGSSSEFVQLATHRLMRLAASATPTANLALAEVSLFGRSALASVRNRPWSREGAIDVAVAAQRVLDDGGRVEVHLVNGWRRYLGEARDLLEMNRFTLDTLIPGPEPPTAPNTRLEGRVVVHPTAHVESSTIVGPAIVGARARVVGSYIGPYTSIGADVRIEGAEIERSIVLAGASIMHVGGRLVSSVVGRDARIFRDFSLPRAMRLKVGDGVEVVLS